MLLSSRGIVLHQIKFSESSVIGKIYTEKAGLQSFLIRGARKKNARIRSSQLQHLSLVEIVADEKPNRDLHYLKSLKVIIPFQKIPFDIVKSSIAVFINEVLYKVIKEEEPNPALFEFLFQAIQLLDKTTRQLGTFHHVFLIQLSHFLGFKPQNNYSEIRPVFNLEEGEFTAMRGAPNLFIDQPMSGYLSRFIPMTFDGESL